MARKETAKQRIDREMGARLAAARKAKGFTQKQMGDHFGITQAAWQNYEYGREMKSSMIKQVCAILECSPSWLLGISDEGQQLPPESPLLVALKEAFAQLNDNGQRKVVGYAEDLTGNVEYRLTVKKRAVSDTRIRKAVGE